MKKLLALPGKFLRKRVEIWKADWRAFRGLFWGMKFRNFTARLDTKYDDLCLFGFFEFTWYQGLGFGVCLGKHDGWIGWPRDRSDKVGDQSATR